jgi:hypothetical protein
MPGFITESQSFSIAAIGLALAAGTVAIHSIGTFFLLWVFAKFRTRSSGGPGYTKVTLRLTSIVLALLLLHLLEVLLWAAYFSFRGCLPDVSISFYFSLITYATVGYGDVVLTAQYRLLGGIEALTGVLMMSWSTALLIAYVQRVYSQFLHRRDSHSRET